MVLARLLKEKPGCQPNHKALSLKSPAHKMCWDNGGTDCVGVANNVCLYLRPALGEGSHALYCLDGQEPGIG